MPHIVKPPKRRKKKRNHDNCKCQKKQIKTKDAKVAIKRKIPLKNTVKIRRKGCVLSNLCWKSAPKNQNYKV